MQTSYTNKNSTYLKEWTKDKLPNRDYWITDVDLFIRSIKGCCMLVEVKCKGAELPPHQKISYEILDFMAQLSNGKYYVPESLQIPIEIKYFGKHVLKFENTTFKNGNVYWDDQEITEPELVSILAFDENCNDCLRKCS